MKKEILRDNKNTEVKILCSCRQGVLSNNKIVYAGESGAIRIGSRYLSPATDKAGYLANIIDVAYNINEDVIALTDSNILYLYTKAYNFKPFRITLSITNDSMHTILSAKEDQIIITGEQGKRYKISYNL